MMTDATPHEARLAAVRRHDPDAAALVERMLDVAPRGLAESRLHDGSFAQTLRGRPSRGGPAVLPEGRNPRYAAMSALGLAALPADEQQRVLGATTVRDLVSRTLAESGPGEPGALALAVWAQAEIIGECSEAGLRALHRRVLSADPISTVAVAWAVTAGVAAARLGDTSDLVADGVRRLLDHRGAHGIFPHLVGGGSRTGIRGHVGSFADQVYPVQALARAGAATADPALIAAADATAAVLCRHQGTAGQWWWHYDTRTGAVVERYPVYSVHQHAMAPMVLFDLAEAGGEDHSEAIARGVGWLGTHPEVREDLLSDDLGVVWRKVGRRERAKAARVAASLATAVRPGTRLPALDRLLPPSRVDHECRPYELGWLLYTWLKPPPGDDTPSAGTPVRAVRS